VLIEIDGLSRAYRSGLGTARVAIVARRPKRFQPVPASPAAMPPVDLVIVSHETTTTTSTIRRIPRDRQERRAVRDVGRGRRALRIYWGVRPTIVELDWWESHKLPNTGLTVSAAPSQHFSGRGLHDRNATLWSSFAIRSERHACSSRRFRPHYGISGDPSSAVRPRDAGGGRAPSFVGRHALGPENALKALALLGGGAFLPCTGMFNLPIMPTSQRRPAGVRPASGCGDW